MKWAGTQTNKIASARVASHSDINGSAQIPRRKKARAGVLHNNKGPNHKAPKNHGTPRHIWELPGNYLAFTVVMVIYHYVEKTWRILIAPIFWYDKYDHEKTLSR